MCIKHLPHPVLEPERPKHQVHPSFLQLHGFLLK